MSLGLRRELTYGYRRRVYYCTIWVSDLQLGTFLKNYLHCVPKYSYQCRRLLWNTCGYESLIFSQWFPTKFWNGPHMWGRRSGRPMFAHWLIENMEWSGFHIIPSRFKPLSSCPAQSRSSPWCPNQAPDPMLAFMPNRVQKERCIWGVWRLQHVWKYADTAYLATKNWWHIAVAKQQIKKPWPNCFKPISSILDT